jgi:hypothetical protein
MNKNTILECSMFWEVLWDIFPTHKKIEDPLMWLLL